MNLPELNRYDNIVIQCHDVPDADTIASGFALMKYIESRGGSARLVYAGKHRLSKPNLKLMLELLDIPLEHVETLPRPGLLVTVDSQYGAGNITKFEADDIAVFDHHWPEITESGNVTIIPSLGSCATLIWDLMRQAGFDFFTAPGCTPRCITVFFPIPTILRKYGIHSTTIWRNSCRSTGRS
jgi:phosphoglycolate phosphatase